MVRCVTFVALFLEDFHCPLLDILSNCMLFSKSVLSIKIKRKNQKKRPRDKNTEYEI